MVTALNQDKSYTGFGSFAQSVNDSVFYTFHLSLDFLVICKLHKYVIIATQIEHLQYFRVDLFPPSTKTTPWEIKVFSLVLLRIVLHPP